MTRFLPRSLARYFFLGAILGALGGIRTPDPQIRSLMLYPAELRARRGRRIVASLKKSLTRGNLARTRPEFPSSVVMTVPPGRNSRGLGTAAGRCGLAWRT